MFSELGLRCLCILFSVLAAFAAPVRADADPDAAPEQRAVALPDSAEIRQARELIARARERFDAGDYPAALIEFTRAHELMAHDPRAHALLNNIAVCQERMFRYDLALIYYQRYLQEGDVSAEDRAEVEAVIRGLRDLLGKLHLTSNVRAEVWVDGRMLGDAPGDIQVPAGARVVELRARGHQASRRTLQVAARSVVSVHFELEPLPTYHGIDRRYFWSGVGLTGVFLVAGTGLGLRALNEHQEAEKLKSEGLLLPGQQDQTQRLALAADICFGAGALFAVGTTVLAFLTDFRGAQKSDVPAATARVGRLQWRPALSAGAWRLSISGAFR